MLSLRLQLLIACLELSPSVRQKSPEKLKGELPAMQDLVPIIHNQSDYIRHLEAEVNFCKVRSMGE